MRLRSRRRRKMTGQLLNVLSASAAIIALVFLAWILWVIIHRGIRAINWDLFTELPSPPGGEGGGLANAIVGTIAMTLIAALIGIPVGGMAGVCLSEFARSNRFGAVVRFMVNVMMGIPSIIMGLFAYTLIVIPMGHFSGIAGGVALSFLMLPNVARTTEDMLTLVPNSLRESALALGAPRWKVTTGIVFRAARTGLVTGVLLAVARISGETAPLLFTALNSPFWPDSLARPTANLTVTIFNYAMSPYPAWQTLAWGGSLLITIGVLSMTILTRFTLREKRG